MGVPNLENELAAVALVLPAAVQRRGRLQYEQQPEHSGHEANQIARRRELAAAANAKTASEA